MRDYNNTTEIYGDKEELILNETTGLPQMMAGARVRKKKSNKLKRGAAYTLSGILICSFGLGTGFALGRTVQLPVDNQQSPAAMESPSGESDSSLNFVPAALTVSDSDVVSVIKNVQNSVVSINVTATARDIFNRTYENTGAGSGIIFHEDNEYLYIVTNHHVITGATSAMISIDDSIMVSASFVGSDKQSDIAVISVSKADLASAGIDNYTIATFGDADAMSVGETVIAIGNAYGEGKSATLGIVSAKDKEIAVDSDTRLTVMQTDAAINPGNSGGALVNMNGQVIGVNTAKLSSSDAEGMGYAIPSNIVKGIVDEIMQNGTVVRPYIGIRGQTVTEEMKEAYGFASTGVYVAEVTAINGQYLSDLRSGDIIAGCNGQPIATMEELQAIVSDASIGDTLSLSVFRNNLTGTINVEVRNYNTDVNF